MRYSFGIAIALYAALVLLVGALFTQRDPQGHYIATTSLAQNHRINGDDLRRPFEWPFSAGWYLPDRGSMEGKYVVGGAIDVCKSVADNRVAASPNFQAGAGLTLVTFPLAAGSQHARILDAGSIVEILSSQKAAGEHTEPKPEEKTKNGKKETKTDKPSPRTQKPQAEKKTKSQNTDSTSKEQKTEDSAGNSPQQVPITATVHAILCDAPTGQDKNPATCYAVLAVPAGIEEYIAKQKESFRLTPKSIRVRDACEGGASGAPANGAPLPRGENTKP